MAYSIYVKTVGASKISVIKVIREITGLGLKEACELVDSFPFYLPGEYTKEQAEKIKKLLHDAGSFVELEDEDPFYEEYDNEEFYDDELDSCIVCLESAGATKLNVIKIVKEVTGLGLKESKDIVDNTPNKLPNEFTKEEAENVVEMLIQVGAKAHYEQGKGQPKVNLGDENQNSNNVSNNSNKIYQIAIENLGNNPRDVYFEIRNIFNTSIREIEILLKESALLPFELNEENANIVAQRLCDVGAKIDIYEINK